MTFLGNLTKNSVAHTCGRKHECDRDWGRTQHPQPQAQSRAHDPEVREPARRPAHPPPQRLTRADRRKEDS